jgi:diguanylate cyclase (GGDEF)-like protein
MPKEQRTDFAHTWFTGAPVPILALDAEGRIRWANHALEAIVGLPSSQLLGHSRESLPSPAYRVLFGEDQLIHLKGPGAPERWLRCTVCDSPAAPRLRLHFFQDVTREVLLEAENQELQQQIDSLRLTDALTGLPNQRALSQQLELQVSRSRRYDNALSLIHVRLEVSGGDATRDSALLATAQYLRDRLRWVDQIAHWSSQEFLVVLPETGEPEAQAVLDNLAAGLDALHLPGPLAEAQLSLHFGSATWQRGDDARSLLLRARTAVVREALPQASGA